MAIELEADRQATELVREGWTREARPLGRRRALTEVAVGGAFLAAALAIALLFHADRSFDVGPTVLLVILFALGIRVQIDVGVTYTAPVQLAFVPMLLLLPTPWVPLLVMAGWLLGRLPDVRGRDRIHPDRLLLVPGNCWFAIGPTLVLVLGHAQTPDWGDWPVYLLALVAQFAVDTVASTLREWLGEGVPPKLQLRVLALVQAIDALLSPLGLLAAFASQSFTYAFLLLVPPAALLTFYATERQRRLTSAVALADSAHDRQVLIAGATHELVTPLAVLTGLTSRLTSGRPLDDARRDELHLVMNREVLALRQLVRQFADYTRLRTDRELHLEVVPVDLQPVAEEVAVALLATGPVEVALPADLPRVLVDPDRLHQMLSTLAADVLRIGESSPHARIAGWAEGGDVRIVITGSGTLRERPFDEGSGSASAGLGLYVTRELALLQGGDVRAEADDGGGTRYTLVLPRAGGGE